MDEYHKIDTVFKRDMSNNNKTLLLGQFSRPEFKYLQDNQWEFTEKVDGTNIRILIQDGQVTFGGRTANAQLPAPLVKHLEDTFLPQTERLAEMFNDGGCLYGEGYGAKIQKGGGNYRPDQAFILFDVKVRSSWWLSREGVADVAQKLSIGVVPNKGTGTLFDMVGWARAGVYSTWGDFLAEGLVARPHGVELSDRAGRRIIAKIKCSDFR